MANKITLTKEVTDNLESLLENAVLENDEKLVSEVIRGYPESVPTFGVPTGVVYVRGAKDFWHSQGRQNVPQNINSVLAIIINGSEQATYDKGVEINDILLDNFKSNKDWLTLNNTVRRTFVRDNTIFIENKNGLRTTIVFVLTHEVYK